MQLIVSGCRDVTIILESIRQKELGFKSNLAFSGLVQLSSFKEFFLLFS